MELIDGLYQSKEVISKAINEINAKTQENENLKIMLWRMIQKHGVTRFTDPIDDMTAEMIISSKFYIDDNGCVVFSKSEIKK